MKFYNLQSRIYEKPQKGQVIVLLLLLMLVALSIGLALTQKSVTDVATSTQSEQSSRAFSAAEAGLEKALTGTVTSGASFNLNNDSTAKVDASTLLPAPNSKLAIEYPPIGRETTAQFWLTDPSNPGVTYQSSSVDLYFGNENTSDRPALEVKFLMESNGNYSTKAYYFDSDSSRVSSNNFQSVSSCGSVTLSASTLGSNRKFYCKTTISSIPNVGGSGNCWS